DKAAFQLGKNVAVLTGAVGFSNEGLELIQYAPTTAQVHARPPLIVPPPINKFYVFDLSPRRGILERLANSGFQSFIVSWRNPTADHCEWDLDTYVEALLQAIEATCAICGSDSINLHGACSGAITISALLGYLGRRVDQALDVAARGQ